MAADPNHDNGWNVVVRADSVSFDVKVAPRASKTRIMGLHDRQLKIALAAPPVDGAANAALQKFLAKALGVPRRAVTIVRGQSSRRKTVQVDGISAAEIRRALLEG